MKLKIVLLGLMSVLGALSGVAQGVFNKGDRKVDLTIGVGAVAYADKSRPSFDQHLGMEWAVASVADKMTFGVGFNINNTYGGTLETVVAGSYDYHYSFRTYGKTYSYTDKKWKAIDQTRQVHRQGTGTGDADLSREDVNAQLVVALHYSPMSRLDTYLKIGAGAGYMTWVVSNIHNEQGFKKADHNETSDQKLYKVTDVYSFNDLDHVKWSDYKSKVVPAMSAYLGATYMLTEKWGVDAQLGLISANIKGNKRGYPNSYGIFALGASYRF